MLRRTFLKAVASIAAAFSVPVAAAPVLRKRVEGEVLPYVMLHIVGMRPCGKPAARMPEVPPFRSTISSAQFRKLDGEPFQFMSAPICGSCGGLFTPIRRGIHAA